MPPKKSNKPEETVREVRFGRPGNNLKIGIVGLPNVGKSSFFNALSKLNVPAENFPFCTIQPNTAVVPVPDKRFEWLVDKYKPASEICPTITVTDIAGLVKGANEGAGLGNEFLSNISQVDAIYHMIRAFDNDEVTHVEESVDPVRDIEIINEELLLKDLRQLKSTFEPMQRNVERKVGGKEAKFVYDTLKKAHDFMEETRQHVRFGDFTGAEIAELNRVNLLTAKEQLILINMSERDYLRKNCKYLPLIYEHLKAKGGAISIPFSVEFEAKLVEIELNGELEQYKKDNPSHVSMLPRILKQGYKALQLIHFFTCGADEVKAWSLKSGKTAQEAAACIHSDIAKGFICAEVMAYEDLKSLENEAQVKAAGKLGQKGRQYIVEDGYIIYFKHNG